MAGVKTQKTELYWRRLDGSTYSIVKVPGVTSLASSPGTPQKIDVTDMDSDAVESLAGLQDNGQLQVQLNLLPWNNSNRDDQLLYLNQSNGDVSTYIIGMSDGTDDPTVHSSTGVLTLAATRSWRQFSASFVGASESISARDAVRITAPLEISGSITVTDRSS